MVHPQGTYHRAFLDILLPLYLVYAEQRVSAKGSAYHSRPARSHWWVEERTFHAFTAMVSAFDGLIGGIESGERLDSALTHVGRRIQWADQNMWTALRDRNLDPSSPLYTYRWLTHPLTLDIHGRAHFSQYGMFSCQNCQQMLRRVRVSSSSSIFAPR